MPVVSWLVRVVVFLLRRNSTCPRLKPYAQPDSRDCDCPTCTLLREGRQFE